MVQTDPADRVTSAEALEYFDSLVAAANLSSSSLRWRLTRRSEPLATRMIWGTVALAKEGLFQARRLVGL